MKRDVSAAQPKYIAVFREAGNREIVYSVDISNVVDRWGKPIRLQSLCYAVEILTEHFEFPDDAVSVTITKTEA